MSGLLTMNIVSIQVDRGEQVRNACKLLKVA